MNIQSEKPQYEPKKMDPVSKSGNATGNPQPCQPKIMDPVSKSHNAASNPPPFEHKKMDPVPKSGNATSNPPPREIQEIDPVSKSCNATSNPPTSEPKKMNPLSKNGDAASYPPPCEHKKMDPVPKSGNATRSPPPREPQEIDPLSKTSNATSNPPPPREPKKIDPVYKTSNATSNPPAPEPKKMDLVPKSSNATSNPSYGSENIDPVAKSSIYSVDPGTKSSISSTSNPPCGPKGIDSIAKSNAYSTSNPCPRMLTNSETIAATTATTTMPNDAKGSDSITNYSRGSGNSTLCDSLESSNAPLKPHTGGDGRWEAIHLANFRESPLGLPHFRLLKRLGYGDIGSVYLVELRGTNSYFAMKVMDKALLLSRNKLLRSQTEREILGLLDHPFLPTLYSHFETDKFYCLVMEFCSGGNLHSLRQRQPNKYFSEHAARFYASEVLLALEYLHMLGIVYRDLKPENVLVRDEGHIMLSDFDLSLRCSVNPTIVKSSLVHVSNGGGLLEDEFAQPGYVQPSGFFPRILPKRSRKSKSDFGLLASGYLPELMAEPTNARSMSFVGTHEYLAPEIIRGEGHGSAVDWWTFGIFLYELLHGTTPFKGSGNRATLHNVVGQPLRFPDAPSVSHVARDLIRGLLVKEPKNRIAYKRGATEIKQHPFFDGVNWALVRSAMPPHIPEPVDFGQFASKEAAHTEKKVAEGGGIDSGGDVGNKNDNTDASYIDFEYF